MSGEFHTLAIFFFFDALLLTGQQTRLTQRQTHGRLTNKEMPKKQGEQCIIGALSSVDEPELSTLSYCINCSDMQIHLFEPLDHSWRKID